MITKEKFEAYEKVRSSGKTNMFDVYKVISLSKRVLDREDCMEIMKTYSELMKAYPEVRI